MSKIRLASLKRAARARGIRPASDMASGKPFERVKRAIMSKEGYSAGRAGAIAAAAGRKKYGKGLFAKMSAYGRQH